MSLGTLGISSVMRRPALPSRQAVCLFCDALAVRRPNRTKASFATRSVSKSRPALIRGSQDVSFGAAANVLRTRWLASQTQDRTAGASAEGGRHDEDDGARSPLTPRTASKELSSLTNMMAYIDNNKAKVLEHRGIPSEADASAALRACQVVADYIMDESVQPQITHIVNEAESTASNLLSLESSRRNNTKPSAELDSSARNALISTQLKQLIDRISDAAYRTLAHPTVFITPELLEKYVKVQATLGRPETLPRVFQLYASKPMPREVSGSIEYTKQNPDKASNAVEPSVAETALDTAIEAKNLDAAVGIIESTYTTKAFIRSKLLRNATVPVATFAATPLAAYAVARNFSVFQDAMDAAQATNVAFVAILAYVGFTATIGIVAATTANDQMKRVTWAPGVALRARWIREEERAALDKIACAWGFAEKWRQGEEEGLEWDTLREYIGQKGMVLDRTELMEGMQ